MGMLQFDVVAYRLKHEYNVDCVYESVSVATARWIYCDDAKKLEEFKVKAFDNLALDGSDHLTYLAPTRVNLNLTIERWPGIEFKTLGTLNSKYKRMQEMLTRTRARKGITAETNELARVKKALESSMQFCCLLVLPTNLQHLITPLRRWNRRISCKRRSRCRKSGDAWCINHVILGFITYCVFQLIDQDTEGCRLFKNKNSKNDR